MQVFSNSIINIHLLGFQFTANSILFPIFTSLCKVMFTDSNSMNDVFDKIHLCN